jgi:hypothetical protein
MLRTCIANVYCLVRGCVTLLNVRSASVQSMDVIHTLAYRISLSDLYAHDDLGAGNETVIICWNWGLDNRWIKCKIAVTK